jgi:drug/metabolite transporter (DMT)-like permease
VGRADFARLVVLAALWGLAFVFIRVAVPAFGAVPLTAARVLLAGIALALYARHLGIALRVGERWPIYVAVGFFNSAAPFSMVAASQTVLSASWAVVLVSTTPLQTAVAAALLLGDRFTLRTALGLVFGIAGVAILVGWRSGADTIPPAWAIACALGAGTMYSIAAVIAKRHAGGFPPAATGAGSLLAAALLLGPLVPFFPPAAMPSPAAAASALFLALGSTALAFVLFFGLIRSAGPVKTMTVNFLSPLFGVTGGMVLLAERPGWPLAVGGALILAGLALVLIEPARKGGGQR